MTVRVPDLGRVGRYGGLFRGRLQFAPTVVLVLVLVSQLAASAGAEPGSGADSASPGTPVAAARVGQEPRPQSEPPTEPSKPPADPAPAPAGGSAEPASPATGEGEPPTAAPSLESMPEEKLIRLIRGLAEPGTTKLAPDEERRFQAARRLELLTAVDELLERFPKSEFRDQACIIKLGVLGRLSRLHPQFLATLDEFARQVAAGHPQGELAAHMDFAAIQVFVAGARLENMPEERRLKGTLERYEAFLVDHPESELIPMIWGSLIRNVLALGQTDRAWAELAKFEKRFPQHEDYKRLRGEVSLAGRIGLPFEYQFVTYTGAGIDSKTLTGTVQVLHFWVSTSPESVEMLDRLRRLHQTYRDQGLRPIGVCLDTSIEQMDKTLAEHPVDWVQYNDTKGFKNDLVVGTGVTRVPTVLVIDRRQTLRYVNPEEDLEAVVKRLLAEPAPP